MSRSVKTQINELLENTEVVGRHSFFQLKYFVIGKEPTIQSKLRRCLLELESRRETLDSYVASIEEAKDDIRLTDLELRKIEEKPADDPIDKEIMELHARKLRRKRAGLESAINSLEKKLRECEEESELFLAEYKALSEIEAPKPYDDLESNIEYWNAKFLEEMNLRLMLQKPLDLELVKAIRQLPTNAPIKQEMESILSQIKRKALENRTSSTMLGQRLESASEVETQNSIELADKEQDG